MSLELIFGSKLYRASKRKDIIAAEIQNPLNVELVNQLSEYLDSQYQKPEYLGQDNESKLSEEHESSKDESKQVEFQHDEPAEHSAPARPTGLPEGDELISAPQSEDDLAELERQMNDAPSSEEEPSPEDEVETATAIYADDEPYKNDMIEWLSDHSQAFSDAQSYFKTDDLESVSEEDLQAWMQDHDQMWKDYTAHSEESVTASTCPECQAVSLAQSIGTIKDSLNSIAETAGVTRIQIKDNEVWIFYNDDINLNNTMIDVIEWMNCSGYSYLEFNRLARSDNAIVFESLMDTQEIRPITEGDAK